MTPRTRGLIAASLVSALLVVPAAMASASPLGFLPGLGGGDAGGRSAPAPTTPAFALPSAADRDAERLLEPPRLVAPTVVEVVPGRTDLRLDRDRDYVLRIPEGTVLSRGLVVVGGRNVVLEPGVLRYAPPPGAWSGWRVRGLYLKGQTGTAHVSGLQIRGPLKEGINLDQRERGATVVLRDVDVDPVVGSFAGHHADLLQTWAGPAKLVVDGFRGATTYQGFFLRPNQHFSGPRPEYFWLRDVDLDLSRGGAYALWADGRGAFPLHVRDTVVRRNAERPERDRWLWPKPSTGDTTWRAVVGR